MSLVINGITVPVAQGGHTKRNRPLSSDIRNPAGVLLSGITQHRRHKRIWSIQTVPMPVADVGTLVAELDGPGPLTVSGGLVSTVATQCFARGVSTTWDRSLLWASLSFDLAEADSSYHEAGLLTLTGYPATLTLDYPAGAGAGTLPALTGTATGSYGADGAGAGTLPAITGASGGTYAAPVYYSDGAGAGTLAPITCSAGGTYTAP